MAPHGTSPRRRSPARTLRKHTMTARATVTVDRAPEDGLHPVFPMKSEGLFDPDCGRSVGKGGMEASTGIEPVYTDLQMVY